MNLVNLLKRYCLAFVALLVLVPLVAGLLPTTVFSGAPPASPYEIIVVDGSGRELTKATFPLGPQNTRMATLATLPEVHNAGAINALSNVPAFDWSYGCSPTAAAMLFGYYDRNGYGNMYGGLASGGICPLNNSTWGPSECPLSATHNGYDGRLIKGHVEDYWVSYNSQAPDPYIGHWTEHILGDCTGDFMGTNQSKYGNTDGSTSFWWYTNGDPLYDFTLFEPGERDGCHGMKLFAESRGYTVNSNFTQAIQGQGSDPSRGFTFSNFQAEIDAGRPVLIQVTGHTMIGYGYNTTGNIIYIHDTWDYSDHQMTWGGTYSGLQHRAVTVIRLALTSPTVTNGNGATSVTATSATLNGFLSSDGGASSSINVYWGTTDGGTTPASWVNNVSLGTTAAGAFSTNISGLSQGITYYYRCYASNSVGSSWAPSSASFVAQDTIRLIGPSDATTGTNGSGYVVWDRWPALSTTSISQIRVKCNNEGNVKVAIYSDSSGNPGTLLNAVNTSTPVSAGWNTIYITSTPVTSGTNYWLAFISDTGCVAYQSATGTPRKAQAATYATFNFPSIAGSTFSAGDFYDAVAGWGVPIPPTVTNGIGATAIAATSATLNGLLSSDGGASTSINVYWGTTDGGTTPASWANNVSLGTTAAGAFSTNISVLTQGNTYYYRCFASNSVGSSWASASSSFIAQNAMRIMGPSDATTGTNRIGYVVWDRWPAESTNSISQIRVKCNNEGNVKVAIYSDSSGNPGTLLNAVNTSTPVSAGWNTIYITSTPVTSGTNYWLAFISDTGCVAYQSATGTPRKAQAATYASFNFPSTAGSTFSAGDFYDAVAGWGVPVPPTVTNGSGATAIAATSATLNGFLISDGGASTSINVYWGTTDGGTAPASWANNVSLGTTSAGAFSTNISGLSQGITYYYRCYASNSVGSSWASASSSFIAQNAMRIMGPSDATTGTNRIGYVVWDRWPAESTNSISQIRVKCNNEGNVKVAIYSDSSGNPGTLLNAVNTSTPVSAGWNTIYITSTPVTSGTNYWLAFISDTGCVAYQSATGTPRKAQAATYASFNFPSTAGSTFSAGDFYDAVAGWGVPIPPTVTNGIGATAIAATSATLNGLLSSDGGASTSINVYWGTTDGGTTPASWANNVSLGTTAAGAFSTNISVLTQGNTYYYRCFASNSVGSSWAPSSASFVAQDTIRLIGPSDATTGTNGSGYVVWDRWPAESTNSISQIRVKCNNEGNVKVAIYSDSSGNPGTLLNAVNTSTPVSAGWNTIYITSTPVTSGTNYWLAFISDTGCVAYQSATGTPRKAQAATYASFNFPSTAGSTFSAGDFYDAVAGWGVPVPPTVTNGSGATAIAATSATLNGFLISDGGASTSINVYWGTTDGGTAPASWANNVSLGTTSAGAFSTNISGLSQGITYYYRCYASNSVGSSWASASSSFIAQNAMRIMGPSDATTGTNRIGYVVWDRWPAESTNSISQIRVKCNNEGNVKVAIYSDSSGNPGTLLNAVNTSTPVSAGWNTIYITSTPVTSGTNYWLAFISDTGCVAYQSATGTPRKAQAATYASFNFPSTAGSTFSAGDFYDAVAGWGN